MLKKDTFEFLETLKDNNNREWFTQNKAWYERAHADVEQLVAQLIPAVAAFDPEAGNREAKKSIFRIYRDIRFSPDKSPYKTNFGAIMGDKDNGYYLHISPDECFLACGYYMVQPDQLKKFRKGIYDEYETFLKIINNATFKKEIGDLYRDDDALQRVPNGFDKDHPVAEYMKLKHFYVMKPITCKQLMNNDFVPYAAGIYELMKPLKVFLNGLLEE